MKSTNKLIRALKTKNLAEATELFSDIMSQKVALRLDEEKKRIYEAEDKKEVCAGCGEEWPCSDSKRKDISGIERAKHHVKG